MTAPRAASPPELRAVRALARGSAQRHRYEIGDTFVLRHGGPFIVPTSSYVVQARMPLVETTLQYRVKSASEGFCRVVAEH